MKKITWINYSKTHLKILLRKNKKSQLAWIGVMIHIQTILDKFGETKRNLILMITFILILLQFDLKKRNQ